MRTQRMTPSLPRLRFQRWRRTAAFCLEVRSICLSLRTWKLRTRDCWLSKLWLKSRLCSPEARARLDGVVAVTMRGVPHMTQLVLSGWLSWKQMEQGHSSSPRCRNESTRWCRIMLLFWLSRARKRSILRA